MSLKKLIKQNASTVLGVDSSTNSFAFCLFDGKPIKWGKVEFHGNNIYDKVIDCRDKIPFIKEEVNPDYICIESAIMVKSQAVAIHMAMIVGALVGGLAKDSNSIITVPPIQWQSYIGNKNLTKADKEAIKLEFPGKSDNWYRNYSRTLRKQRTLDYFNNKFNINVTDNDVGDAFGLAYYAHMNLVNHV
jgi:Holliday junction resolvasome RuvABC endonuclease subunit